MKAVVPSRWTGVVGSIVSLLAVWAVFVVPSGPRWAGYVWLVAVGMIAATVPVLYAVMHGVPGTRQLLDRIELEPALAPVVVRPPVRR